MPLGVMGDEEEEMFGRSFEEDDLDRMEGLIANAMGFLPPAGKAGPSSERSYQPFSIESSCSDEYLNSRSPQAKGSRSSNSNY